MRHNIEVRIHPNAGHFMLSLGKLPNLTFPGYLYLRRACHKRLAFRLEGNFLKIKQISNKILEFLLAVRYERAGNIKSFQFFDR